MNFRFLPVEMLAMILAVSGCPGGAERTALAQQSGDAAGSPPARVSENSITVYPILITPSENMTLELTTRFAVVVGTFLERAGLEHVDIAKRAFRQPESKNLLEAAKAFGTFVAAEPVKTEYALLGEIIHSSRKVQAIRTIVVDKEGNVVLADEDNQHTFAQTSNIAPKNPMMCCVFLARKVQKLWGLADPLRKEGPPGKLEARLRNEAGAPSRQEREQMATRFRSMQANLANARLTVYPVRSAADKRCAEQLAGMLNEQGICTCEVAQEGPSFAVKGHFDEQKVLWDTAKAFRDYLRANPADTEYALYADYGIGRGSSGQAKVGHVHFLVCDRAGDWVLVDYQNSHHRDFLRINPRSSEDCNRLVSERLKGYLGLAHEDQGTRSKEPNR